MSRLKCRFNRNLKKPGQGADLSLLSQEEAVKAMNFHRTFAEYRATPLVELPALARDFGLGRIWVKDESARFSLNAFKVLGGAYAIGQYLAKKLGRDIGEVSREYLASEEVRKKIGPITFASATDGNHGRGVAWTARQLGQKSVIFMPQGSARVRVRHIQAAGAECIVTDLNYDDTVRLADRLAQENGWVLIQDTAWEGYTEIPTWIMQGYMTLAEEALAQIEALGAGERPTHLFLQAGVGSFAGAVLGRLAAALGGQCPTTVIVEPHQANCIYNSAVYGDGQPHPVSGALDTIMAGLACGEPSIISWGILRDYAAAYLSIPDFAAANGMRILAAPRPGDAPIISGESGAAACGALEMLVNRPFARRLRQALGLSADSKVLLISTEGATAPETYRDVVWFGRYADGTGE